MQAVYMVVGWFATTLEDITGLLTSSTVFHRFDDNFELVSFYLTMEVA